MASSSASLPPGADITALKTQLYDACVSHLEDEPDIVFHQNTLFELEVIPNNDVNILLQLINTLLNEHLFKVVHDAEGMGWKLRTLDEAKKFRGLSAEQAAVYGMIDEAGEEGIWTKTIKQRLNLHDAVFRSAVKHLESRNMIADMKSVEHPTRKMYIKSSLRPSDRATGGPWYTDGELDEEFINTIMQILYEYVKKRTFYRSGQGHSPKRPKKIVKKMTPEEAKAARDKSLGPRVKTEQQDDERSAMMRDYERYVPMPAGYKGYPTLSELTSYVENSKFTSQTLTATEIEQLLDILCYDDRVEKIAASGQDGFAYKALRKTLLDEDYVSSVLIEAPCGRCPVFDICEEGGPVGPSNCEYFNDWLNL